MTSPTPKPLSTVEDYQAVLRGVVLRGVRESFNQQNHIMALLGLKQLVEMGLTPVMGDKSTFETRVAFQKAVSEAKQIAGDLSHYSRDSKGSTPSGEEILADLNVIDAVLGELRH